MERRAWPRVQPTGNALAARLRCDDMVLEWFEG